MAKPFPQEVVRKKRDGHALTDGDIRFMIEGLTDGSISDGQVAAFAMAVFFQGMKRMEVAALTKAMADSGRRLTWKLPGPVIDKHSTGGVGDKVSLMLAPIAAACGVSCRCFPAAPSATPAAPSTRWTRSRDTQASRT